jgi:hypothetical protein
LELSENVGRQQHDNHENREDKKEYLKPSIGFATPFKVTEATLLERKVSSFFTKKHYFRIEYINEERDTRMLAEVSHREVV